MNEKEGRGTVGKEVCGTAENEGRGTVGKRGTRKAQSAVNVRALVLTMLLELESGQEYSNVILRGTLLKYDYLSAQEKAFIKRLFEGCVEYRILLDHVLNAYSKTKTDQMKPVILEILRMGVYQLLYMDAVPDAAAINEAVRLAEKRGFHGLKGFVNGVLRTVARNRNALPMPDETGEPMAALSVKYAMPEWLVCFFCEKYGISATQKMLVAMLSEKPVSIRMDERLSTEERARVLERMRARGIGVTRHPYLDYAYLLSGADGVRNVPGFAEGAFYVQDVSSMLVSEAAGIREGMRILDVCAAPGGKSLHAAVKLHGTGMVESRDLTEYKTAIIEENRMRCHCDNLTVRQQDAVVLREEDVGQYDIVYADVPCSGLGIMGKKCDIRHRITPKQMEELAALQRKILDTACACVREDGVLIYSTCTINPAENEEQLPYLIAHGFAAESLDPYLPEALWGETTKQGYLQLLPGIHETDGFFLARLRKRTGRNGNSD
ncbi:MAG: 16S rRNA (cytosine(967)-C(5))-methyltransferase RsmB [bacterium]|nr:16S rRNA (cytosine(967)-C(5))-methyltransferase RsmB [bacterium]